MGSVWKTKVILRFDEGADQYELYNEAQNRAAEKLATFLPSLESPDVLELGCGTGDFTQKLLSFYAGGTFHITDVSQAMLDQAKANVQSSHDIQWDLLDAENPETEKRYDVIASSMTVQWFSDLSISLEKLKSLLKPGGVILYSMPGPKTFQEWNSVLADMNLASGVLDFAKRPEVFEEEDFVLHYDSAFQFLQQMKMIGAHTPREGYKALSYREIKAACQKFDERYQGRVSWQILYGQLEA